MTETVRMLEHKGDHLRNLNKLYSLFAFQLINNLF